MDEDQLSYLKSKYPCAIDKTSSDYRIVCHMCRHYYYCSGSKLLDILQKSINGCICNYKCHKSINHKLLDELDKYGNYALMDNISNRVRCLKCACTTHLYRYNDSLLPPICECNEIELKTDMSHVIVNDVEYNLKKVVWSQTRYEVYIGDRYICSIDIEYAMALSIFQKKSFEELFRNCIIEKLKIEKANENY